MKRLFFVRHGESELNLKLQFAGQVDTPLTDHGRDEAKSAGVDAKNYKIDLIVSSPLSRALETAQIVAKETGYPIDKIITNDIFKEHNIKSLAYKSWDEYDEFDARIPDMETWEELVARAKQGLEYLQNLPAENILLVGHGSFVRALQTAIDPGKNYPEPPNAKISQLI